MNQEIRDKWYYIGQISQLDPMYVKNGCFMTMLLDAAAAASTQDVTEEQARLFYEGLRVGLLAGRKTGEKSVFQNQD